MAKRKFPPVHPGVVLAEEFLKGLKVSQYRLAKGIGVPPRRINEIVVGRLGVADVRAFGLTWADCEELLGRLGFSARIEIVAA
jgi:addiction module HigA family antidote